MKAPKPDGRGAPAGDAASITVRVDGEALRVAPGTLVAAALEIARPSIGARVAPGGQRRQAFCGMGICGECRVTVDGRAHRLGCQLICTPGMEIRRDA
jgi:hypothetical protein